MIALLATQDWRFVIPDLRDGAGAPFDMSGYAARVTFRPADDMTALLDDCSTANGKIAIVPGGPGLGPGIVITSYVSARKPWLAPLPAGGLALRGDVMISSRHGDFATSDPVQTVLFTILAGTTW